MSTEREEPFSVEADHLVRSVVPRKGRPYEHRCERATFERIAHACDEAGERGVTLEELVAGEQVPHTQAAVALAFLKERGCVTTRFRRSFPASGGVYEDAMIEWHALREGAPGSAISPGG